MTTHDPHPATTNHFTSSFNAQTQQELKAEDSEAWTAIVALLLGIISTGVLLAVLCVLLTTRYMH